MSGFLSFGIAACVALLGSGSPILTPKIISGITLGLGLMKAIVGIMQKDAGTTPALTPAGNVEDVKSRETPVDPKNIPVDK